MSMVLKTIRQSHGKNLGRGDVPLFLLTFCSYKHWEAV